MKKTEASDKDFLFWQHGSWLFFFSVIANLLMLAMPLYLAQIYDRVLPGNSLETLFFLSLLMGGVLAVFGAIESLRSRIAQRMSADFDLTVTPLLAKRTIANPGLRSIEPAQRLADVATVRQLLSSRGFIGLFDLPFAPVFLLILFFVHPLIGIVALAGAGVLVIVALMNERMARDKQEEARKEQSSAGRQITDMMVRMDDVRALGLASSLFARWEKSAVQSAEKVDDLSTVNANFFGIVRFSRQVLQIFLLGTGAYLVLDGSMSAGLIFAASTVSGRALQPVEHLIGSWRQLAAGRAAWDRVMEALEISKSAAQDTVLLNDLAGNIDVEDVFYTPGGTLQEKPLLTEVSFSAKPGEIVAFIGQSGAGKSTLLRLLAGIHSPVHGALRYDGFEISNWDPDQLGGSMGYLGQDLDFFSGTIAENISRFTPDASDEEIIAAAECAGAHAFIGSLENGYATPIGPGGIRLSGGQKQRVALARAFFRDPAVLLLDEPDANLDTAGTAALRDGLLAARMRKKTIIVVTHRSHLLEVADKVLVLKGGEVEAFGPRTAILASPDKAKRKTVMPLSSVSPKQSTASGASGTKIPANAPAVANTAMGKA